MTRKTIIVGAICYLLISLAFVSTGLAQTEEYDADVTWTKPGFGSDPVLYHVWVREKEDGTESFGPWGEWKSTPELKVVLTFKRGFCYEVKVNAEDIDGIIGPDSKTSVEYCVVGVDGNQTGPGQPGQPIQK